MLRKHAVCLISILNIFSTFAQQDSVKNISFLSTVPQYLTSGKNIKIWHEHLYKNKYKKITCHVAWTTAYKQSFKNAQLAETLFGTTMLSIAGSDIQGRTDTSLIADYFGLSPLYQSTVFIRPSIKTGVITGDFILSLGQMGNNIYVKTALPLCISKWSLDLEEIINPESQTSSFPAGYMSTSTTNIKPFATSFKQAVKGKINPGNLQPLIKGKMKRNHKIGVADIPLTIGWHAKQSNEWGLSFEAVGSIPTGNSPKGNYLFEPIIGNRKEPLIGLGLVGYIQLWQDFAQQMYVYLTGYLFHSCKSTQYRSFDLKKNGFLSRYLLVKEFDAQENATGTIIPLVNISTLACKVNQSILFDGTALFAYSYNNFYTDLGYNGFIKSKDNIKLIEAIPLKKYGIKGTQYVFNTTTQTIDSSTASSISITQGSIADQQSFADPSTTFITTEDLSINSAQMPLSIIHTFFASIGYRAQEETKSKKWLPFFGVGAEVSLEGLDLEHFSNITKHSISQWSLYLKGGFTY
ncbi:hypothetical protein EKK58_02720 [Candidatus Dependentiae bacterium]|nr:MAG: hypothetical protein EKK58_02720 [Candidatus Dependentiae bacterium]